MKIMNDEIEKKIQTQIIKKIQEKEYDSTIEAIPQIIDALYANIPDNKRISYGIVHTVKVLSEYLYTRFTELNVPVYETASNIFYNGNDFKSKGVSLGILSFYGLDDYEKVLPYFESAAVSSNFDLREMAQMFFRKIIKMYPNERVFIATYKI